MTDLDDELRRRQLDRAAEFERRRAAQARLRAQLAAARAAGKRAHHTRRLSGPPGPGRAGGHPTAVEPTGSRDPATTLLAMCAVPTIGDLGVVRERRS